MGKYERRDNITVGSIKGSYNVIGTYNTVNISNCCEASTELQAMFISLFEQNRLLLEQIRLQGLAISELTERVTQLQLTQ